MSDMILDLLALLVGFCLFFGGLAAVAEAAVWLERFLDERQARRRQERRK